MESVPAIPVNHRLTSPGEFSGPLFVAIPLPASGTAIISSFVKGNALLPGVRWIPAANYHVTLLYIGCVKTSAVNEIQRSLLQLLATLPAFELAFREIAVIQKKGREKIIWARYVDNEYFTSCSLKIREALAPLAEIRSTILKPVPHTTLARFKNADALEGLKNLIQPPGFRLHAERCELWETNKGEQGVFYRKISSFELKRID